MIFSSFKNGGNNEKLRSIGKEFQLFASTTNYIQKNNNILGHYETNQSGFPSELSRQNSTSGNVLAHRVSENSPLILIFLPSRWSSRSQNDHKQPIMSKPGLKTDYR